jgi:integrase
VLYSIRHTFLTRLGESGCNVWTLACIAGHSSIVMSQRYVHPDENSVLGATAGMAPPHSPDHSEEIADSTKEVVKLLPQ